MAEKQPLPKWVYPLLIVACVGLFAWRSGWFTKDPFDWYTVEVVASFPHDPEAYTQGFEMDGENYYESTGKEGESSIRIQRLADREILKATALSEKYFGEGITLLGDTLYQLTWKAGKGFLYDRELKRKGEWEYEGEGWGLTNDGKRLIMSDGTHILRFIDPETMKIVGRLEVMAGGKSPVNRLNELEYIKGEVWANLFQTNTIVSINPDTGEITRAIDCTPLRDQIVGHPEAEVLNGIAYDKAKDRILLTGKLWPKIFEVKVVEK